MGLLLDSKELREKALSSNLYKPNNVYELSDQRLLNSSSSILNVLNPNSFVVRNFRDQTPLVEIANNRLAYAFEQRIKSEAIDEVLPPLALDPIGSVNDILKGTKSFDDTLIRSDDYRISKESSLIGKIGDIIERSTGINFPENTEKNSYYQLRNQSNWSSSQRIKNETGRVQLRRLIFNSSENFYSKHSSFGSFSAIQGKLEKAIDNYKFNESVTFHLNLGARTLTNANYVGYLKIFDNEQDFFTFEQDTLRQYNKENGATEIANTYNTDQAQEKAIIDGEFGRSNRKTNETPTNTSINEVQTNDEYIFLDSFNSNKEISYGNTTLSYTTSQAVGFGARRGLLYYTNKVALQENGIIQNNIDQKTVIYNDSKTEISYKVRPCRNFTKIEREINSDLEPDNKGKNHYYGKTPESFIRYHGNGKVGSVLQNYVTPRITPPKPDVFNFNNPQQEPLFFSLENLAWTKEDLIQYNIPYKEWGNNYGRYMWFAPYITSYSEKINPNYEQHKFIGRTEPIFTYSNTVRTATMEFFLIIDYPMPVDVKNKNDIAEYISCNRDTLLEDDDFIPDFTEYNTSNTTGTRGSTPGDTKTTQNPDPKKQGEKDTDKKDDTTEEETENQNDLLTIQDVEPFKFYFPNDVYNVTQVEVSNYEDFEEGDINVNKSLSTDFKRTYSDLNFGLNEDFNNFFSGDTITQVIEDIKYYNVDVTGYASKLYIGNVFQPSEYNVYLSARRALSTIDFLLTELGISSAEYNNIGISEGVKFNNIDSLSDLLSQIDNITPNSKNNISFSENSYVEFYTINDNLPEIIRLQIKGSSKANDQTNSSENDTINSRSTRESRFSEILFQKNNEKISEENALRRVIIEEQNSPPVLESETNQTNNNNTNSDNRTNSDGTVRVNNNVTSNRVEISDGSTDLINYERYKETHNLQKGNIEGNGYVRKLIHYGKKDYYVDLFHANHPEDYHRRRTFLAQLGYPGNAKTKFGSSNSAFGRMPIAILRIGDFIHSKVVIDGIDFSEEELIFDFNYEGMGVQPMITKVSLSFTILGGHSLKSHIDRLQNAVSFNHYANSTYYSDIKNKKGIYNSPINAEVEQLGVNKRRKELIPDITVVPKVEIEVNSLNQINNNIPINTNLNNDIA